MKWHTFLITLALLFTQCGSDDTPPWDDPDRDSPTPWRENFGTVTMKIDGRQIDMRAYDQANFGSNNEIENYVRIEAANCEGFIDMSMMLTPQTGAHDILRGLYITDRKGPECFSPDSGAGYQIGQSYSIKGTCNITELEDRIKGTFEFTAGRPNDDTTYIITDGSFDIEVDLDSDG